MTIPNGQVVEVTVPGSARDAMVELSIGLNDGTRSFGGAIFRTSADGASFVTGLCGPMVPESCPRTLRTLRTLLPSGVSYEEHRMGNSERHLSIVVFRAWAMQADAERAANFDFRTDELGFPLVHATAPGYTTDQAIVMLYTDNGAGRYRVTAEVGDSCSSGPPALVCVAGVSLTGPPGPGSSLSVVGAATTPTR